MSLRFVIGRAGSGKTTYCLEEIAKKQQEKTGRFLWIVPEQYSFEAERELMETTEGKGILQAEVLSFGRLAHKVFQKRGLGKTVPLGDLGKSMLLRKIVNQKGEQFVYFKHSLEQPGFIEKLSTTIAEVFQYCLDLESLEALQKQEQLPRKVRDKLQDICCVVKAYQEILQQEYVSNDEMLDLLAERLSETTVWEETEIWVDGFYSFTPQEYNVIRQLLRLAKRVTILLTLDEYSFRQENMPMFSGFFEPFVTAQKWKTLAREQGCAIEQPAILKENQRAKTEALAFLEKNYFRYYRKNTENTEGVVLFRASDQYAEITAMAEEILRIVREEHLRYREIAVVTNALEQYKKSIRGILEEFQIPYFIDAKREILSHPLIELVRGLIESVTGYFRYESVFRYLKTGYSLLTPEEVDILENYVLAYGIKGYKWKKEVWEYGLKKSSEEEKEAINTLRQKVIVPLQIVYELAEKQKKRTVLEWVQALVQALDCLQAGEKTMVLAEKASERGDLEKAKEHQQIWGMLTALLEKCVEILGKEKMTLLEFSKIIEAGLEQSEMGMIPPTADGVLIGDLERSRLPEIKVLFILGVNEGILPAPFAETGVFSEGERESLQQAGAELSSDGKRRAFEEQYLIYRGLTKPSEKLYISYCTGTLEGNPLRPSSVIGRLKKMYPTLTEMDWEKDVLVHIVSPETALHRLGEQMRRSLSPENGVDMEDIWRDVYSFYASSPFWEKKLSLLKKGLFAEEQKEVLSKKIAEKFYGNKIFSSVSQLERFAACPFSFFVEYGLQAKERQLYQLQLPDLGILFHQVMEYYAKELAKQHISWRELEEQQSDAIIETAVEEAAPALGNQILFDTAGNQYLIHRLKRISKRAAWTLARHIQLGDFEPYGYEVGFGIEEKMPPIVIELAGGEKLLLRGKIDRIDILDKENKRYVKIIDYKSGSKEFDYTDIFYGLQLQLLIYLDAFLKSDTTKELVKPGAIFYFRMRDPSITVKKEMSAEEIYQALFQELKMSGLVLEDVAVIQGLDKVFQGEDGVLPPQTNSSIIPVGIKKDGEFLSSTQVATEQKYDALLSYAMKKAKAAGEAMVQGEISPTPYRKKEQMPCQYCPYRSICLFDVTAPNSQYRKLESLKKEDFWQKITEELEKKDVSFYKKEEKN